MVKIFRVTGQFKHGKQRQKFTKEIRSMSEQHVVEKIYSELGSEHGVKRNLIDIEEIEEIEPEEAKDPRIRASAGVK